MIRHRWRNCQPKLDNPLWVVLAVGLLLHVQASAQSQPDPGLGERQAKTLARALAYDANLPSRAGRAVVLAVVYKPENPVSDREATEAAAQFARLESYRILGLPFHPIKLPFSGIELLDKAVGEQGVVALYVCSGLESETSSIKRISRKHKTTTIASSEAQVTAGLTLGVFSIDRKLTVIVNLAASREEGAQFSSDLLRLAKVIH